MSNEALFKAIIVPQIKGREELRVANTDFVYNIFRMLSVGLFEKELLIIVCISLLGSDDSPTICWTSHVALCGLDVAFKMPHINLLLSTFTTVIEISVERLLPRGD
jgi:hypothetical protein